MQIRRKRPNDGYTKRRRKKILKNITFQYRSARLRNKLRWNHQKEMLSCTKETNDKNEGKEILHERAIHKALILFDFILNIQESLSGDNQDIKKAKENLEELFKQQFTFLSLMYAPFIVKTVYECRKYQGSEEVRIIARKCYKKFRPLFGIPYGETFETVFQTSVRDFWKNQKFTYNWEHFYVNGINGKTKCHKECVEKEVWQNDVLTDTKQKSEVENFNIDPMNLVIKDDKKDTNGII